MAAVSSVVRLLRKTIQVVPQRNLWVNPDCGLKTRHWPETEAALANMVEATRGLRAKLNCPGNRGGYGVEVTASVA